jgi:hypothetical protein
MTKDEVETLARAVGLEKVLAEHAADVAAAVASARQHRAAFLRPSDPAMEPMPAFGLPRPAGESAR